MSLILKDLDKTYRQSQQTNILDTWRKTGWIPPSEHPWYQEKWATYRHLAALNEEKERVQQ